MPIHDWTRVGAGIFHDFHCSWIVELGKTLNNGALPSNYYAMIEQVDGDLGAKVRFTATAEMDQYVLKQHTLVIRHSSGDRIIAFIEILSPGNKASRRAFHAFVEKATDALARGYHLLLLDLIPPGPRDPQGIHGAIWSEIADDSYAAPPDQPLTLAAYSAGNAKTAYIEPAAVGSSLPDMPLFLDPHSYVSVPLEATYHAAWRSVPQRWRAVLGTP